MTIEFKDGRYFAAVWFIDGGSNHRDWMGAVYKDEGEPWQLKYRFRYYHSVDPWSDKDTKSWYSATIDEKAPEAEVVGKIDEMARVMVVAGFGPHAHKLVLQSSDAKFCGEQLSKQFWAHSKVEKIKDKDPTAPA